MFDFFKHNSIQKDLYSCFDKSFHSGFPKSKEKMEEISEIWQKGDTWGEHGETTKKREDILLILVS